MTVKTEMGELKKETQPCRCCNCRYCHHAHYWRFDEDDETCQVVMETCQCRKNPPRGGVFRGPGGAEKAPLGGFSLGISALGRAEGVAL